MWCSHCQECFSHTLDSLVVCFLKTNCFWTNSLFWNSTQLHNAIMLYPKETLFSVFNLVRGKIITYWFKLLISISWTIRAFKTLFPFCSQGLLSISPSDTVCNGWNFFFLMLYRGVRAFCWIRVSENDALHLL